MNPENPYATPGSQISQPFPEDMSGLEYAPATRGERFGGAFIDGIVSAILGALAGFVSRSILPDPVQMSLDHLAIGSPIVYRIVWLITSFLLFVVIQGYFLAENGQTIGKKLLGTKIVTLDGAKPRMSALLFLRYFIPLLVQLIPQPYVAQGIHLVGISLIFLPARRCLHDYIAGTKVIQTKPLPAGNTREGLHARMPELILAAIIRKHLGIEPAGIPASASWTRDLGLSEDQAQAFHQEIARAIHTGKKRWDDSPDTYGELLASLDIPYSRMERLPAKPAAPAVPPPPPHLRRDPFRPADPPSP